MPDVAQNFTLTVLPEGRTCQVLPGQTLLDAVLAHGLAWERSCRNGTCRTCLGQVVSGEVRYRVDWPGLSPEEKEWGCVLPCVAEATSDVTLRRP